MNQVEQKRFNLKLQRSGLILIGIFILSLLLRLIYLYQIKSTPIFGFFAIDSRYYDTFALKILEGNLTFKDSIYLNPLYPFFLAAIYRVFGHNLVAVGVVQAVLDSLNCIFLYLICVKIFKKKSVGLLSSFIYACYWMAIFYTGFLLDVTLSVFLCVSAILILLYAKDKNISRLWFSSGLIIGLSTLLKANIILFLPFLAFWLFYSHKKEKLNKKIRVLSLIAIGMSFVLLPFSVRNYMIEKRFSPLPVHGGLNFYAGNNPDATGSYMSLSGIPYTPVIETKMALVKAEKETGRKMSSAEASNYWFIKGLKFITNNPRQYSLLILKKLFLFWNHREIRLNINYYFCKRFIPLLNFPFFPFGVIAPFAISGFIFAMKKRSANIYLIILFIFSCMTSLILLFVTSRLRLLCVPFLIILASFALYNFVLLIKHVRIKEFVLFSILFFTFFLIINRGDPAISKRVFPSDHNCLGIVYGDKGMFKEAIAEYQKALKINPNFAYAYYNLGIAYRNMGKMEETIASYKKAIETDPGYVEAYNNLGSAYQDVGKTEEAIALFKKAIEINPYYPGAYYNLGKLYQDMGKTKEAISLYKKTIEVDPDFAMGHNNLALAYYHEKKYNLAIEHCDKALRLGYKVHPPFLKELEPYRK